MALETVEVRQPRATVEGEQTDGLTISWSLPVSSSVTGFPSLKYSGHPSGEDVAIKPTAEELITKVADAQNAMFEEPVQKTVLLNDGKNDSTFRGYDSGPHYSIMLGGVNNGKNIVHRAARLDFINTSIYVPTTGEEPYKEGGEDLIGLTPTAVMRSVLENIIKSWERSKEDSYATEDPVSNSIRDRIHAANIRIITEEWYPALDASVDVTLDGFSELLSSSVSVREKLEEVVTSVYLSGAEGFVTKISQFESLFQIRFIPDPEGQISGKFISFKSMVNLPQDKSVYIRTLTMAAGPRKFLVPTSVVVKGLPKNNAYKESSPSAGTSVACWPAAIPATGQAVTVQAPAWVPNEILAESLELTGDNLDIAQTLPSLRAVDAQIKSNHDTLIRVLQDYARCVYNNIALGDSSVTITTLLDFSWQIGFRYKVSQVNNSGESPILFDGFLRDVQHTLNSSPQRVDATTMLTFSHVEANGFVLTNK